MPVRGSTPAGVLVPLYLADGELHAVFTERSASLSRHGGEISFPGGRPEAGDDDLVATALREAHEEIGLAPDAVEVIGALAPTPTRVSGFAVYPFVGMIAPGITWVLQEREVARVLESSVAKLSASFARRSVSVRGTTIETDTYLAGDGVIWGATARIVADLLARASG